MIVYVVPSHAIKTSELINSKHFKIIINSLITKTTDTNAINTYINLLSLLIVVVQHP